MKPRISLIKRYLVSVSFKNLLQTYHIVTVLILLHIAITGVNVYVMGNAFINIPASLTDANTYSYVSQTISDNN